MTTGVIFFVIIWKIYIRYMLSDIFLSSIDLFVGNYKIKEDKGQTRSNIPRKPQFFHRRSNAYFLEQSRY